MACEIQTMSIIMTKSSYTLVIIKHNIFFLLCVAKKKFLANKLTDRLTN